MGKGKDDAGDGAALTLAKIDAALAPVRSGESSARDVREVLRDLLDGFDKRANATERAEEILAMGRDRALTVISAMADVELVFVLEDELDVAGASLLERDKRGFFRGRNTFVLVLPASGEGGGAEAAQLPAGSPLDEAPTTEEA